MREELAKKKDEYMKLDDLIKQQRIYISSNYEAYLGKEFINVQRLTELDNIISQEKHRLFRRQWLYTRIGNNHQAIVLG